MLWLKRLEYLESMFLQTCTSAHFKGPLLHRVVSRVTDVVFRLNKRFSGAFIETTAQSQTL